MSRDGALELSLREHLMQVQSTASAPPNSQHDQNIDPAIAGNAYQMSAGDSGGDDQMQDTRKGRRELSTSKRAAQNRAAQRAFRQRKEEYIKSLKDQVKEYETLNENYKAVQAENYQLRDYIINLQSRLLESQGSFPEPPVDININRSAQPPAPEAPAMSSTAVSQLVSAAQATEAHADNGVKHDGYVPAGDYPSKRQRGEDGGWSPFC
ncbi:hypothetical protein NA57DRAFT_77844 [Rhizodiscina lignyota]|uniref:Putative transcription factor kapC n=1 Tax=Rhizodiscina lignyota TaxID=1504668 RepID=A0A9P4ICR1_9PEZI|nr:hypothetical protein NA57DRAFT_77844 [Rhizodiscina lignyota]